MTDKLPDCPLCGTEVIRAASLNYECSSCRLWGDPLAWSKIAKLKQECDEIEALLDLTCTERDEARAEISELEMIASNQESVMAKIEKERDEARAEVERFKVRECQRCGDTMDEDAPIYCGCSPRR